MHEIYFIKPNIYSFIRQRFEELQTFFNYYLYAKNFTSTLLHIYMFLNEINFVLLLFGLKGLQTTNWANG